MPNLRKKGLIETGSRDWINPQDLMTGFWNANESPEKADLSELVCSSGIFRIYVVLCAVDRDSAWWLCRNSSKTGRKSIICIYFAVRNFCLSPRWVPLRIAWPQMRLHSMTPSQSTSFISSRTLLAFTKDSSHTNGKTKTKLKQHPLWDLKSNYLDTFF